MKLDSKHLEFSHPVVDLFLWLFAFSQQGHFFQAALPSESKS